MRHFLVTIITILASSALYAQNEGVSIKNSPGAPHSSAMLDVESSTKGVLVPRVYLLGVTNTVSPVFGPTVGLLVYNLTTTITGGAGYFYWNGTAWVKFVTGYNGELWSKINVSGSPSNHIEYFNGNVQIGNSAGSTAPLYDLEVRSGTSNALTCFFESNGTQLRWGYNDLNGETGGGVGNWLTQKTKTVSTTGCSIYFQPLRYVQLYEPGDWGFGITSWGKCRNTIGWTTAGTTKNNLSIGTPTNAILSLGAGTILIGSTSTGFISFAGGSTNWASGSDSTLKKNIEDETSVLSRIMECRAVTYNMKSDGTERLNHGFIAQEIVSIFPELVFEVTTQDKGEDGEPLETSTTKKAVSYTGLISVLLKAIQEQKVLIDDLQEQINGLPH